MIRSLHGSDNKWFKVLIMTDVVSQKYALNLPHVVRYLLFVRETLATMIKMGIKCQFLMSLCHTELGSELRF